MNPVYFILGTPGSGRRGIVRDLIENGLGAEDQALVLLAEGEGVIIRVGDKTSIFNSALTYFLTRQAIALAKDDKSFCYQRALMPGGTCEATAFAALGYEATGLCLALDNYHNMVDIDGVRAGKRKARLAPEAISLADFHGPGALGETFIA